MSDLLYAVDDIRSQISGDYVVITIHKNYLKRSVESGITTGTPAKVINEKGMLEEFIHGFMALDDGGSFNHCIDSIASEAIECGEEWLEAE